MKRVMAAWTIMTAVTAMGCVADVGADDDGAGGALSSEAPVEDVGEAQNAVKDWIVKCSLPEIPCMIACAYKGVSCAAKRPHPHGRDPNNGSLIGCAALKLASACVYDFSNGERCYMVGRLGLCEILR